MKTISHTKLALSIAVALTLYATSQVALAQDSEEQAVETIMFYLEDELDFGFAKAHFGLKQFYVDVSKNNRFNSANDHSVSSDSDLQLSAGFGPSCLFLITFMPTA